MLVPDSFDLCTLQHIYDTMPESELRRALDAGVFDLQKGLSHLHPQKVLVHGKHGPYYAVRMVSDERKDTAPEAAPPTKTDAESGSAAASDIEKYSGRTMIDVYGDEGRDGVMRALGAQYAEKGKDRPGYQLDKLEELYGHSDTYTAEAAARVLQIWTGERIQLPETEGMDEEELEIWYDDEGFDFPGCKEDGTVWGCSLMRRMRGKQISAESESQILAGVAENVLEDVIEARSEVYNDTLYRGVVMPPGTIEEFINGKDADLGGISSFTGSQSVGLNFIKNSPVWVQFQYEYEIPESIMFVIEKDAGVKSLKVQQSQFANEQEHLVGPHAPFSVSRIALDDPDGLNLFDDLDEEEYDPYEDHTYYVYLEEKAS